VLHRDENKEGSRSNPPPEESHNPAGGRSHVRPEGHRFADGSHSIALEYKERSRIVIDGPFTGRMYEFSGENPVQMVDSRDATTLLSTRFFVRR
jgi:hypothetical protein